jgi:hypothetical protein
MSVKCQEATRAGIELPFPRPRHPKELCFALKHRHMTEALVSLPRHPQRYFAARQALGARGVPRYSDRSNRTVSLGSELTEILRCDRNASKQCLLVPRPFGPNQFLEMPSYALYIRVKLCYISIVAGMRALTRTDCERLFGGQLCPRTRVPGLDCRRRARPAVETPAASVRK